MKINNKKMISILTIFLLIVSFNAGTSKSADRGQGGEIIWYYDADLFVKHIRSADLNGDNIEDIFAAEYDNEGYDDISKVYGIDGKDGQTLWTYTLQSGARCMTIGDINNDGTMDAVVGASMGGSTPDGRVHAINGLDGSEIWIFSPGGTGDTIGDVAIGDFNGDAYPDVAVACWDDFVYGVDGATGTELWNREIGSIFINAVDTADVDGDGFDDVSYAHDYLPNYDNKIGVLNGTNGLIIWQDIIPDTAEDTILADIDNDGTIEAIYGVVKPSDEVEVLVKTAIDGTFEWSSIIGQGPGTINPNIFLFTHDVDQDSDLELLVGNEYVDFIIRAYEGDQNEAMWESELLNGYPRYMSFADVDGNGYQDIIAATYDRVQIVNATNGVKGWYQSVAGTIRSTAPGDFNDDGVMDVACSGGAEYSGDNPAKAVWGLKTVEVSPVLWEYAAGSYGNAVDVGDFNGDGILDAIGVNSDNEAYAINGSDGSLLWQWITSDNLYTVATGDFNNDGADDAAVAGAGDVITALDGLTGDILWEFTQAGNQYYRSTCGTADLNTDGHMDVIAGNDDSFVYAINGDTGGLLWSIDLDGQVRDIQIIQMNGAGVEDIVAAAGQEIAVIDGSDGSLIWNYTNDVSSARNVVALDADDDGVMDVAWGNIYKVELINGAGQTLRWSLPYKVNNDYGLAAGDIDQDQYDDVIVGGGTDGDMVLALNGLDGSTIWDYTAGGDLNCVKTSDVNEDGILEVVAGADDQYVYVLTYQGYVSWSYSTADDVMDIAIGDITGDNNPNIVAITFGFDGVIYAFNTLSENTNNPPIANFEYSPMNPTTADNIQFTDLSVDPDGTIDSWLWDFGDGSNSTLQHPMHQYQSSGEYVVILTVMDDAEGIDTTSQTITVTQAGPIADFTYQPLNPLPGETIQFNDTSVDTSGDSIVSWSWDFGDGNTSTMQDPVHAYALNGSYVVNLSVMNSSGASDSVEKMVMVGSTSMTIPVFTGWNLISLPVMTGWYASDLIANTSDCLMVSWFDAENQTFRTATSSGGYDFPLFAGWGYFVYQLSNTSVVVNGSPVVNVSVPLEVGWNMIGWYHDDDTMASSLMQNISGCIMVSWYDNENETYRTATSSGGYDFVIQGGMGLFVYTTEASVWYGEG